MTIASKLRLPPSTVLLSSLLLVMPGWAVAQTSAPAATTKPAPSKPVSESRKDIQSQAKGLALATDVTETISANQMAISSRVLTGVAQCEFNQTVEVRPMKDKPGHFRVEYKNVAYVMTPEETTTGAVRLYDKRSRVVWLQIPSKSMMMDQGAGRRMVDSCQQTEQRIAVEASKAAGQQKLLSQ
jgi:hypothetical protein